MDTGQRSVPRCGPVGIRPVGKRNGRPISSRFSRPTQQAQRKRHRPAPRRGTGRSASENSRTISSPTRRPQVDPHPKERPPTRKPRRPAAREGLRPSSGRDRSNSARWGRSGSSGSAPRLRSRTRPARRAGETPGPPDGQQHDDGSAALNPEAPDRSRARGSAAVPECGAGFHGPHGTQRREPSAGGSPEDAQHGAGRALDPSPSVPDETRCGRRQHHQPRSGTHRS